MDFTRGRDTEDALKALLISLALAVTTANAPGSAVAQAVAKEPQRRLGQVFIVGNDVTRQSVILDALNLYPGQPLRDADLRTAQKNLEALGIFAFDPAKGIRPLVAVMEDKGEFRDILVQVRETFTRRVRLMLALTSRGEPAVSVVLEERNFDPLRWPTSLDDWARGGFRGAGQLFRLELLQVPLCPHRWPRCLAFGSLLLPTGDWLTPR